MLVRPILRSLCLTVSTTFDHIPVRQRTFASLFFNPNRLHFVLHDWLVTIVGRIEHSLCLEQGFVMAYWMCITKRSCMAVHWSLGYLEHCSVQCFTIEIPIAQAWAYESRNESYIDKICMSHLATILPVVVRKVKAKQASHSRGLLCILRRILRHVNRGL